MELHMCLYLRTKFQVSSIILTSFREGVILPHLPQNGLVKSSPRLMLNKRLGVNFEVESS